MKKIMIVSLLMFASAATMAQARESEQLYWVVETNPTESPGSTVRFYNGEDVLVHEIKTEERIDIRKNKHKRKLNVMLKRYSQKLTTQGKKTKSKSSV